MTFKAPACSYEKDLNETLAEAVTAVQAGGRRLIDVSVEGGYEEIKTG